MFALSVIYKFQIQPGRHHLCETAVEEKQSFRISETFRSEKTSRRGEKERSEACSCSNRSRIGFEKKNCVSCENAASARKSGLGGSCLTFFCEISASLSSRGWGEGTDGSAMRSTSLRHRSYCCRRVGWFLSQVHYFSCFFGYRVPSHS